jgi:hypothetical protein
MIIVGPPGEAVKISSFFGSRSAPFSDEGMAGASDFFRTWVRRLCDRKPRTIHKAPARCRPAVEALEPQGQMHRPPRRPSPRLKT